MENNLPNKILELHDEIRALKALICKKENQLQDLIKTLAPLEAKLYDLLESKSLLSMTTSYKNIDYVLERYLDITAQIPALHREVAKAFSEKNRLNLFHEVINGQFLKKYVRELRERKETIPPFIQWQERKAIKIR